MTMRPILVVLSAAMLAGPAAAQAPKPPDPPPQTVVVVAPIDPNVTSTFPADGAAIAGGTLVLKIAFDRAMTPEAWAYRRAPGAAEVPDCLARPRLLNDKRTFVLLCSVGVNTSYALAINPAPGFTSTTGRAAAPYVLHFTTNAGFTLSLHDALAQAGLGDDDDPIMGVADAPDGASAQSKPLDAPPNP